ncbi:MAG: hypothetical protein ACC669_11990, partial [bacterium]
GAYYCVGLDYFLPLFLCGFNKGPSALRQAQGRKQERAALFFLVANPSFGKLRTVSLSNHNVLLIRFRLAPLVAPCV